MGKNSSILISAQAEGGRLESSFEDEEATDDVDNEDGGMSGRKTPKHPVRTCLMVPMFGIKKSYAKPKEMIAFDNYLRAQHDDNKPGQNMTSTKRASSDPTTDGETRASNRAFFLIMLVLTTFLEMFPQMSWCYSKYMAALDREAVLLRRQSQLETSSSTSSGDTSRLYVALLTG